MASLFTSYFRPLGTCCKHFQLLNLFIFASDNHAFIVAAKAAAKDKETQDLYAICDVANKNYIVLENDLSKCPRFVSDCQNALGSKTTPEMLDRSRKQFDLLIMSKAAEGLIKK
ncbi:hypothetical protein R3W88_011972 [Solanum pinnatisectum]|uniref:Pectinesterase inhibitor domain-containing protein n=1 Tax=Solanum pinnatisectum TaxID=50273 RepID=A0AAV9L8Q8_9SOLN|nr:hypothetical protein R3W88_011972 [Solanum pinnatisectum]